eukprot:TRINITY_DN5339_c0_g1_i2.p1 TRINITY_DN5339_c0_g1~~TRINITY_DN5339_c0_g1_i2.p1  ORF type:complete len:363 (-),score=61.99 TRINITY_DN5339_c0_g1_i2:293-1381(-)
MPFSISEGMGLAKHLSLILLLLSSFPFSSLGLRILGENNATSLNATSKSVINFTSNHSTNVGSPPKQIAKLNRTDEHRATPVQDANPVKNETVKSAPKPPKQVPKSSEGGNEDRKGDDDSRKGSESTYVLPEICDKYHRCQDNKSLVSCLRVAGNEMQELSLLIQNKGKDVLNIAIHAPTFLKLEALNLTMDKYEHKMVQVTVVEDINGTTDLPKIIINAGSGNCVLNVSTQSLHYPLGKQSLFDGLSYYTTMRPTYGITIFLFIGLIIGGTWLFCKFHAKGWHNGGMKYQGLEMNHVDLDLPLSATGKPEIESTDGWDEVWDDNWEDAEAGKSSETSVQSFLSKGLATRRSNKDGWDTWDE